MKHLLLIGLGNPGVAYEGTRHNVGILFVRRWVRHQQEFTEVRDWREDSRLQAEVATVTQMGADSGLKVDCLFPLTFMNTSGNSVQAYQRYTEVAIEQMLIVHDDMELPLGDIQLAEVGGSAKGHNGVRSIQERLDTVEIPRLRIGIGRPPANTPVTQFVLSRFTSDEQAVLRDGEKTVFDQITDFRTRL